MESKKTSEDQLVSHALRLSNFMSSLGTDIRNIANALNTTLSPLGSRLDKISDQLVEVKALLLEVRDGRSK